MKDTEQLEGTNKKRPRNVSKHIIGFYVDYLSDDKKLFDKKQGKTCPILYNMAENFRQLVLKLMFGVTNYAVPQWKVC